MLNIGSRLVLIRVSCISGIKKQNKNKQKPLNLSVEVMSSILKKFIRRVTKFLGDSNSSLHIINCPSCVHL